jgi:outer membrane protein assembly factor BamB
MRIFLLAVAALALSAAIPHRTLFVSPQRWVEFRLNGGNNVALSGGMERRWTFATNGGFSSSSTIVDGTLYIGNNGGQLYAIDPANGKQRWRYTGKNPFMTNPLVVDGVVIVGEGNQTSYHDPVATPRADRLLVGTGESGLLGLDAKTGRRMWFVPTKGTAMPTAAIVGDVLIHHDGAGYIRAIDPRTGTVRYARYIGSVASMSAIARLPGGVAVTAGSFPSAAIAIDAATGKVVWRRLFPANASGVGDCPPANDDDKVLCNYFVPGNSGSRTELGQPVTQHVYALDARSGSVLWDVTTETGPLPKYNEASIPLLDRGVLFEGNACAPWMNAIEAKTGALRWRTRLLSVVKGGISTKDGILYFGDNDGHLWALNEQTGRVVGDKDLGPQFNVGSPIIVGNTIIIGSNTGSIIAIPLSDIRDSHDV